MRGKIVPFRRANAWAGRPRAWTRRARAASGRLIAVLSLLLVVIGAAGVVSRGDLPLGAAGIRVLDGDTIVAGGEHVRLVGLNAPEIFSPACPAELSVGTAAKDRLVALVRTGKTDLVKVPCACPPGTEGTAKCNYGRACGRLMVDGTDVATILIAERLAVPYQCGRTHCPRLPRPWCGSASLQSAAQSS